MSQPLYNCIHREEEIDEMIVDSTNYKTVPASNHYGNVSEAHQFEEKVDAEDEDYVEEEEEYVYRPDSRDDEEDEEDEEDEDFNLRFKPKTKPKPRRESNRTGQRRFASTQQLEKERQRLEQSRAIEALEVLVAREILDAVETLPAIEMNRDSKLRQDLSTLLLPSSGCVISPNTGHMNNESHQSNSNSEIESNSVRGANESMNNIITKSKHSPNIAVCTSNELLVKQ
ncbi:hypothetical protein HW132_35380 [Brasilonema sp. CT11]|nr:hypothetical protein [Brasilonema sp. CT11]